MNVRFSSDSVINQWLAGFQIVKESVCRCGFVFDILLIFCCCTISSNRLLMNILQVDGKTKYVKIEDFTEDLFFKMVDQLLHSRTHDVDLVFSTL